jgi:hypothetical protein
VDIIEGLEEEEELEMNGLGFGRKLDNANAFSNSAKGQ